MNTLYINTIYQSHSTQVAWGPVFRKHTVLFTILAGMARVYINGSHEENFIISGPPPYPLPLKKNKKNCNSYTDINKFT